MAEKNENNKNNQINSERNNGRIVVNRPVVSVGRIKKNSASGKNGKSEENGNVMENTEPLQTRETNRIVENPDNKVKEETTYTYEQKKNIQGANADNIGGSEKKTIKSVGARLKDEKLGGFLNDNGSLSAGRMLECGNVDIPLLMIFIVLAVYGIIMVFSASYAYAYSKEDNSYAFIKKQIIYLAVGVVLAFIITVLYDKLLNRKFLSKAVMIYFGGAMLMLLLVFVPGLGIMEGVTRRWLNLGIISLQPSEFAKGALILTLALYYSKYENKISRLKKNEGILLETILPYCIAAVVIVLVFLEKHMSGTIILGLITILMVFTGEKHHKFTLIALTVGIIIVVLLIGYLMQFEGKELKANAPDGLRDILQDYSWKRIEAWLDPDRFKADEELWQTMQGLNAIGSGGFMGVGFGQSRQKHLFVSQPQNDFIFTIVCEEMGFVGGAIVVILFIALMWRGYVVGKRIPDTFSRMSVWGLCISIGMQAFLNMGVVTSLLPNTGISLPFFSYGGSSIISLMIEVGIILAMSRYARKEN